MSNDRCICIAVRKASRRLTARYDDALAPLGINLAQFSLLRNINRHGPVSLTRLGEITELDRSTLGRNVRVLERMNLCAPAVAPDKREASVTLSEDGMRKARLNKIAYIPQGAMNSLNPVMRIGEQMSDAIRSHIKGETRA